MAWERAQSGRGARAGHKEVGWGMRAAALDAMAAIASSTNSGFMASSPMVAAWRRWPLVMALAPRQRRLSQPIARRRARQRAEFGALHLWQAERAGGLP